MSKPPPHLLRSMPQAKQAAKALQEAIHTSAVSSVVVKGKARENGSTSGVVKDLLRLSVRGGRAEGGRGDVGSGGGKEVEGEKLYSTVSMGPSRPNTVAVRRPARYRLAGTHQTSSTHSGSTVSGPSSRPYNTSTNHHHPTPSPFGNPNPSPFFLPSQSQLNAPSSSTSNFAKWFDANNTSNAHAQSSRPPTPPSPSSHGNYPEGQDLPSVDHAAPPPPPMFTLVACTSSQHQHLHPTSTIKGRGRAYLGPISSLTQTGDSIDPGLFDFGQGPSNGNLSESEPKSSFIFHPGAFGIPKKRYTSTSLSQPQYTHPYASTSSQTHPSTSDPNAIFAHLHSTSTQIGEDAYYTLPLSLGIADGVGGWSSSRDKGVRSRADPGRFSRLLMAFCEEEVRGWERGEEAWLTEGGGGGGGGGRGIGQRAANQAKGLGLAFSNGSKSSSVKPQRPKPRRPAGGQTWMFEPMPVPVVDEVSLSDQEAERVRKDLCPVEVMQRGYEKCLACVKAEGLFGSATCLLAVLMNDELRVANLGDCAIVVIRDGEIVFRTEEMQHSFNFPLQLGTNSRDEPMKDAQLFKVKVQKDDIVIMCSDGLVDNLFDEDILEIIATFASPSTASAASRPSSPASFSSALPAFSPQGVSEALCRAAKSASEEPGSPSPFMCKALDEGIDFLGGKKDDISVLVAVVQDRDEA